MHMEQHAYCRLKHVSCKAVQQASCCCGCSQGHAQSDRPTHSHIRLDRLFVLKCPASPEVIQLGVTEHVCLCVHILSAVCTLYAFTVMRYDMPCCLCAIQGLNSAFCMACCCQVGRIYARTDIQIHLGIISDTADTLWCYRHTLHSCYRCT